MTTIAIIQARLGSTRLPGKVLFDLEGKTVLERVIERVRASKLIDDVVVATTIRKEDLRIVKLCADIGTSVYCGSVDDVLDRYYQAARLFKADHVVRITSDCPLIDPEVIDSVIKLHFLDEADYSSNIIKETYPDGEDVEVFTFEALKKAWKNAHLASEREHVTPYLQKNSAFKIASLEYIKDLSHKRWTLDNPEDYEFIKLIFKNLHNKNQLFGMNEILKYIDKNPEVEKINKSIIRNEGYLKSLKEDKTLNLESIEDH